MRKKQIVSGLMLLSMILLVSASALADDAITYAADQTLIHQILTDMELAYELAQDDDDDPIWTFTHLGILITIIPYDEVSAGTYGSLLFYTGWATDTVISLSMVNDWNSRSRFGRAYVDTSGDPVIELDLLMTGGVTATTIREYISVFAQAASNLGVALGL